MKSFCVIGLGKFGMALAETLVGYGKQVMVIDVNPEPVTALADIVTNAVIGDATNENLLRASGVADYECAVVCMTSNTSDIILVTILLKELGVNRVIARAVNDGHKKVLERIGADSITFPERDAGEKLAFRLSNDSVAEYIQFTGYKIFELILPDAWVGKSLVELDLRRRYNVNVIAVSHVDGTVDVSPDPTRAFVSGERLSVIGGDRDIERLTRQL